MSDNGTAIRFSLKRKETFVFLEGEDGKDRKYTLREISGRDRDEFTSIVSSRVKLSPDGKVAGMRDTKGLQSKLVSLSLFDEENKQVKQDTIESWPSSTLDALYKMAQDLSALTMGAAEEVGKE